jgi:glyoxylase-like metal-dependent hydrolase (beta-lactamase superfamily II)
MKIETVRGMLSSNTFIVSSEDTVVIIDAGAPLHAVQRTLNGRRVSAILLTHEHFDHVFYTADYLEEFQCPLFAHPATLEELKTSRLNNMISFTEKFAIPKDFSKFNPTSDEGAFTVGNLQILPYHAPGHSEGSTLFLIGADLFTGDVLFAEGIGRTDLMKNGAAIMQNTLRRLLALKFETAHHGHFSGSHYAGQMENIKHYLG